jgi:hypothetical protein
MSYYLVKNKYSIPGFVFVAIASWVVVLAGVLILLSLIWVYISATGHREIFDSLSWPFRAFLGLSGAYAAVGAICLYVTMWVYWIAVERSSISARIGWLLALLFGLYVGALVYAIVVWRRYVTKFDGPQPIRGSSVLS